MTGYKKLDGKQLTLMVGRISRLYFKEGKTLEEIAGIVKEPLQRVEGWIQRMEIARELKQTKEE